MRPATLETEVRASALLGKTRDNVHVFEDFSPTMVKRAGKEARKRRQEDDTNEKETKKIRHDYTLENQRAIQQRKANREAKRKELEQVDLVEDEEKLDTLRTLNDVTRQIQAWKKMKGVKSFTEDHQVIKLNNPTSEGETRASPCCGACS